jgi:hypothetical protein
MSADSGDETPERVDPGVRWSDEPAACDGAQAGARARTRAPGDVPADELDELLAALERVPWRDVPGVAPVTAATFSRIVREARDHGGDRQ